jgi:hypothetical protein
LHLVGDLFELKNILHFAFMIHQKAPKPTTPCTVFNPLHPELNPICYLLALLAHDFLHVSRIRVKSLTLNATDVIYIYIYIYI